MTSTFKLRLTLMIIFFTSMCYTLPWFSITMTIFNLQIDFKLFSIILTSIFVILECNEYTYKYKIEINHFIFWFFYFIGIVIIYFVSIKTFLLSVNHATDFFIITKYIQINIQYTVEFKLKFLTVYLNFYLEKQNYNEEKLKIIQDIIRSLPVELLINNPIISIEALKQRLIFIVYSSNIIYENIDLITKPLEDYAFYNTFGIIKKILAVAFIYKFIFSTIPKFILITFFKKKAFFLAQSVLLNSPGVIFDMSTEEFYDLSMQMTILLIKHYNSIDILTTFL